ncbi:MAG: hypothetical protein ACI4V7_01795 [Succinivibrionaceae bacterium]
MVFSRKKIVLFILCYFLYSNLYADESAPLPPPELGETLTSFKTKQQMLEQGVVVLKEEPKIKIYKKDNNGNLVLDTKDSNKSNFEYKQQVINQPKVNKEIVENEIVYEKNKQFHLNKNTDLVFKITDAMDIDWPITKVDNSNQLFLYELLDDATIRLYTKVNKVSLSKLKIYLGNKTEPLMFILSNQGSEKSIVYKNNIKVAGKSPKNTSNEVKGLTNIKKTAKSRTTFREIASKKSTEINEQTEKKESINTNELLGEFAGSQASSIQNSNISTYTSFSKEEVNAVADSLLNGVLSAEEQLSKKVKK